MGLDGRNCNDEDTVEKDGISPLRLPKGATMEDFFIAEGLWIGESDERLSFFDEEVRDSFGDSIHEQFVEMRTDAEWARRTKVVDFFGGEFMTDYLPIRFDLTAGEWEQMKVRNAVHAVIDAPKPIEEAERVCALERIAQIFSDVGEGDLPFNDAWNSALQQATSAVPLIVAARRLAVPDEYIRRCALVHVKKFVVSADRNRNAQLLNFGVIAKFLKNMKFGTDDDVAFFEHLASGGN